MAGEDFRYGTVDLMKEESNLLMETSYETEIPALHKIFDSIEAERLFYGSNYPDNFTEISLMKFDSLNISKDDLDKIMYKNAQKLLDISKEGENL